MHVLRLADGTDRVIGADGAERFLDSGLAYSGARLRFVPFSTLPLR